MAQLSDDCFAFGGELMRTDRALEILESRLAPVTGTEAVPLAAALGRILAEDITAPRDVPPKDNAAVDGFAVAFDDLDPDGDTRLPVAGRIAAGHPLGRAPRRGEAYRIFTGAPMPEDEEGNGPDTVLMQEDCTLERDRVIIPPGIKRGANRRPRGEDIEEGAVVLRRGQRLRPQDIGVAASVGRTELMVHEPLRVAVFSTGDEVVDPGQALPEGGIYDSNRYGLIALLAGLGCRVTDLGILPDRFEDIRAALAAAAPNHDAIITSGGISTGEEDHVRAAVEALGSLHFWRLSIKPGRPIAFGLIGREGGGEAAFIGLPGNPVAVMVTFMRLARPALLKLAGGVDVAPLAFRVPADFAYRKRRDRREWIRARLVKDGAGHLVARRYPKDGSGILTSMVESDGLIELPEEVTELESGDLVDFLPFSEMTA
jgi:molybdopterin molybdotransferase